MVQYIFLFPIPILSKSLFSLFCLILTIKLNQIQIFKYIIFNKFLLCMQLFLMIGNKEYFMNLFNQRINLILHGIPFSRQQPPRYYLNADLQQTMASMIEQTKMSVPQYIQKGIEAFGIQSQQDFKKLAIEFDLIKKQSSPKQNCGFISSQQIKIKAIKNLNFIKIKMWESNLQRRKKYYHSLHQIEQFGMQVYNKTFGRLPNTVPIISSNIEFLKLRLVYPDAKLKIEQIQMLHELNQLLRLLQIDCSQFVQKEPPKNPEFVQNTSESRIPSLQYIKENQNRIAQKNRVVLKSQNSLSLKKTIQFRNFVIKIARNQKQYSFGIGFVIQSKQPPILIYQQLNIVDEILDKQLAQQKLALKQTISQARISNFDMKDVGKGTYQLSKGPLSYSIDLKTSVLNSNNVLYFGYQVTSQQNRQSYQLSLRTRKQIMERLYRCVKFAGVYKVNQTEAYKFEVETKILVQNKK